jgi:hypothetical protein
MHSSRKQYSSGQQNLNSLQINGQPINDTKEAHRIGKFQLEYILHSQVHFSATTVFASIFSFEINPFLRSVN